MDKAYTIHGLGGSIHLSETESRQTVRVTVCGEDGQQAAVNLLKGDLQNLKGILPGYVSSYNRDELCCEELKPEIPEETEEASISGSAEERAA